MSKLSSITKIETIPMMVEGKDFFRVDGKKVTFSPTIFYKIFNTMGNNGTTGSGDTPAPSGGPMGTLSFGTGGFGESIQAFVPFLESIREANPTLVDDIATAYWQTLQESVSEVEPAVIKTITEAYCTVANTH
jgi:hypothetical protein